MSPHDMTTYNAAFDKAIAVLGWTRSKTKRHHERDDERSWTVEVLCSPEGKHMMDISDMSEAMVKEIIRIANMLSPVVDRP